MPIPTHFHSRTAEEVESQEWRSWAGYLVAATYEPSHEREYFAIRNAAALIDVSPLFKYEIHGPQALQVMDRIVTRDLSKFKEGRVLYTPWCDDDGKVIDDGTLHRLSEQHFRITAAEPNLAWFEDCAFGLQAEVRDVSDELASVALQGPTARRVLNKAIKGGDWKKLKFYHFAEGAFEVGKKTRAVFVSRTGYTGDLGYELWIEPDYAGELWDRLIETGQGYGLLPAGMAALDIARIEAGLLMLGVDYISSRRAVIEEQKSSPFELGLGWTVALNKTGFVGQKSLRLEKERGSKWAFVGLEVAWDSIQSLYQAAGLAPQVTGRASRIDVPVYKNGRQIGHASSHTFSPILKKYIALATIDRQFSLPGTRVQFELTVEHSHRLADARVVKLPFFNPPRKKQP
jgi:aminomethyltransferase